MNELRETLLESLDGWRFDQNWIASRVEDFPEHKDAGCGCGVCQKMDGLNGLAVDSFLDAVLQALPKGGQVPEDIREHKNRKILSAVYKNGWSDCDKEVYRILKAAKSQETK